MTSVAILRLVAMCDAYASRWHGASSAMDDAVDAKRHCGASCTGIRFAAAVTRMGDRSCMWVWQWRRDIAVEEETMAEAAIRSERTVQHPSRGSESRESRLGSGKDGRCTSAYRQCSMFRRVCKKSQLCRNTRPATTLQVIRIHLTSAASVRSLIRACPGRWTRVVRELARSCGCRGARSRRCRTRRPRNRIR